MPRNKIFEEFLNDPILIEKQYIDEEKIRNINIHNTEKIKILEILKLSINGGFNGDSRATISRGINQILNSL